MTESTYKLSQNVLYKNCEVRGGLWSVGVVPSRIKTIDAAIEYLETGASEENGMSVYDESQR